MRTLNLPRLAVVIGAVTILGYVVMRSLAAGPLAAFEPETGILSGSATVQTASGASGSGVVKFAISTPSPTPAPTATPTPGGKPGASNTGIPAGTSLTVVNGDQTYSTNGQVISGLDIRGYVRVNGANITIKNSIIRGGTKPCTSSNAQNSAPLWVMESATNFTFQDSEIAPSNATACMDGIWASNSTILRANIHGAVDGVKAYDNVTIRDSYIHDLAYFASDPNQGGERRTMTVSKVTNVMPIFSSLAPPSTSPIRQVVMPLTRLPKTLVRHVVIFRLRITGSTVVVAPSMWRTKCYRTSPESVLPATNSADTKVLAAARCFYPPNQHFPLTRVMSGRTPDLPYQHLKCMINTLRNHLCL
ncbi:hypothetical protein IPG36_01000 [bacterium]|nr:MAG: hypothetical protein IPG36_01000 [bacterium]